MKLFGFSPEEILDEDQTGLVLTQKEIKDIVYQSFENAITLFFDKLTTGKCNNCKNNRI